MIDRPLVFFHPEVVEEIEAAIRRYANRSRRAAQRFVDELHAAVETIEAAPNHWPEFEGTARRALLRHTALRATGLKYWLWLTGTGDRVTGAKEWNDAVENEI